MQKTIVLFLAFLCASLNYSKASGTYDAGRPDSVITLIIDADMTVILVHNENTTVHVEGDTRLKENIRFRKAGDTLAISSAKNRNFKGSGVVYVPANQLRNIRINSQADVRSLFVLRIPKLDVVVNGACTVAISNIGELNITETSGFSVDQTTNVRHYPTGIL